MASWKSYRIIDVINDIEDEKFVLPVIQRRLVWDDEKMLALFDTLLKGDSFGGIMVIEEEKDTKPLFSYRAFSKDGEIISSRQIDKLTKLQNFVIDGQQRLQSFYIGLKGSLNGQVLYFDLYSDFSVDFEFKFEKIAQNLPTLSKDNKERPVPEHNWYLAGSLLQRLKDTNDEDQVSDEIISIQKITDELRQTHIKKNVKAFYKNILTSETLGISKVVINKSLDVTSNRQRIVELFRRLNDGGTKLSSFDLVASILKGYAWEMEGFLEEILVNYGDIGLTQDNLIKLIFLLEDNHRKEMAAIEAADADFAIKNKERIKATLKSLKDFLIHSKLYDYYKEGNRSFIPLFFIAYHIFHKQITTEKVLNYFDNYDTGNTEFPKMKQWIFHSLLNGVFRSKGAGWIPYKTGIRKLLEEIQKFKNYEFPTKELFQVYNNHPITFTTVYDANALDSLDNPFLFYLMYDLSPTARIQDFDHIMPKSILTAKGYDVSKINSIRNMQLLDYQTNRWEKIATPFKDWVNNPKSVSDKNAYIERHLIPKNDKLWVEDNFEEFINERGEMILDKIMLYVSSATKRPKVKLIIQKDVQVDLDI